MHVHSCADSCALLINLLQYLTSAGDLHPPPRPPSPTEIAGQKIWRDNNNADGSRPASITVKLLRDGLEIDSKTVTAADNWRYSFGELPMDDGYGTAYKYTISEVQVNGYITTMSGYNIINTRTTEGTRTPTTTDTNRPPITGNTENLENLVDILDYETPLWGDLLGTGQKEAPVEPYVFGGAGMLAIGLALVLGKRRRKVRA